MSNTTKPDANPRRSHGLLSRITRRWRLILALWMITSTAILYLIHFFVAPTFEAFSILSVTPTANRLFEASRSEYSDFKSVTPYLQTQVNLITSDRVLGAAINYPEVINLSTIRESDEPRAELRKAMTVEIVKDAFLIRVALELADGNQAATIVNSVVQSYLAYNGEFRRSKNSILRTNLETQAAKFKAEIEGTRAEFKTACQKSLNDRSLDAPTLNESGKAIDPTRPVFAAVTEAQSQKIADELINTDLEIIKAQSILDVAQAASKGENYPDVRKSLSDLRFDVAALVKQREHLVAYFKRLKVEGKSGSNDTAQASFFSRKIDILLDWETRVRANVRQLDRRTFA